MQGVRPIQGTGLYTSISFVRQRPRPQTSDSFFPSSSSPGFFPSTKGPISRGVTSRSYLTTQTIWGDELPSQKLVTAYKPRAKPARRRNKCGKAKQGGKKAPPPKLFPCISYQEDNEGSFSGDILVLNRILQRQAALDRLDKTFRSQLIHLCGTKPAELMRPSAGVLRVFRKSCIDLDRATLVCVRSLQEWRKNFIGRKEFRWGGCNYISRIPPDLDALFVTLLQTDKVLPVEHQKHAGHARTFIKQLMKHVGFVYKERRYFILGNHGDQEKVYLKVQAYIRKEEVAFGRAFRNARGEYIQLDESIPVGRQLG